MFELIVGRDAVQRRTQQSFEAGAPKAEKRSGSRVLDARVAMATGLRRLADRLEPVGSRGTSEPAVQASGR